MYFHSSTIQKVKKNYVLNIGSTSYCKTYNFKREISNKNDTLIASCIQLESQCSNSLGVCKNLIKYHLIYCKPQLKLLCDREHCH